MANTNNNPLLKLKEKKDAIHTPTITTPFSNNADVEKSDNAAVDTKRSPSEARENEKKPPYYNTPTYFETQKKESKNIKYNLIIDKNLLFTLKAVANYQNKPINKTINEALKSYFDMLGDTTIKEATDTYNKLLKLKGGKNGN